MNPIERAIRRVDAAQQRHRAPAFVVGVIKKYGDDNGGVLAAASPTLASSPCSLCCWSW
jgi:hypothetical protein